MRSRAMVALGDGGRKTSSGSSGRRSASHSMGQRRRTREIEFDGASSAPPRRLKRRSERRPQPLARLAAAMPMRSGAGEDSRTTDAGRKRKIRVRLFGQQLQAAQRRRIGLRQPGDQGADAFGIGARAQARRHRRRWRG